jgi:ABC-type oligopeptide transport system substrate-binding subunit
MRKALSLLAFAAGCGLLAASALASVGQGPPANTLRISWQSDVEIDPARADYGNSWALQYATGAFLLTYPDAPAPRGSRLVPELAAAFPTISRDGLTYTFRIKRGRRFSNGQWVTAGSFARAIYRTLHGGWGAESVADLVGAETVMRGRASRLRGVRVVDRLTLRLRIRKPAPDLLARLAMPFFAAAPPSLGFDVGHEEVEAPVSAAGPYYVRERTSNRRIVLVRNPYYRGTRPRKVDRIVVDIGLPPQTTKLSIDRGEIDIGDVPTSAHAELGRRFGVRRRSPGRYFANPTPTIYFVTFNHARPLFGGPTRLGNVRLKKAVNFALDRSALIHQHGAYAGSAHDQLLAPGVRGFRDVPIYPARPDLRRARALASGSTREAKGSVYCSNGELFRLQCQIIQANLREIGLDISRAPGCPAGCIQLPPHDLALGGWRAEFLDPAAFTHLVDGASVRREGTLNDTRYNRKIRLARQLTGTRRYEAFGALDVELMRNAAPLAVFGVANERHYVSARLGCYHHHPVYGFDFPAICLRR